MVKNQLLTTPLFCSSINEYDLMGFSDVLFEGKDFPCLNRPDVIVELNAPDTLLPLVEGFLKKNKNFVTNAFFSSLDLCVTLFC